MTPQSALRAADQDKDRLTAEDTFAKLIDVANSLNAEQRRGVEEGLSEKQSALPDLLQRSELSQVGREQIKKANRERSDGVSPLIAALDRWTGEKQTKAREQTLVLITSSV